MTLLQTCAGLAGLLPTQKPPCTGAGRLGGGCMGTVAREGRPDWPDDDDVYMPD